MVCALTGNTEAAKKPLTRAYQFRDRLPDRERYLATGSYYSSVGLDNDKANFAAIQDLELQRITVPTLLVHGRVDSDVAPGHTEFAGSLIPGAELEWIERGGHLAVYTDHASTAIQARIVQFLTRA